MIPDKQSRASYTWELTLSRCPLRIGLASFCCRTRWLLWRHTRRELEQKQEQNSYLHLKNSQFWPLVLLFFHALSDPGFSEWCDYLTSCIVESTRIKPKYFFFFSGPLLQYEARSTNMRNRHMRTTRPIAWSFDILLSSSSSINRRWAGPS